MNSTFLGRFLMAAVLLGAGVAGASTKGSDNLPQGDDAISKSVRHEVLMYPYYSIWDDVSFRVANGQVELIGAVNQPFKKADIERLVRRVPGVTSIANELKVLPVSFQDDRLRLQIARAIYRDPVFTRYAIQPVPPIHIIVDNGHVTLTGTVNNDMEKQIAGMRASGAGLSFGPITNNLQVEHPAVKKS
ncbi:MAG: BON domain-containing protein [Acidobacteriia bacterium]|nr:BON domain-containing protein [Terriglobia bacterium]